MKTANSSRKHSESRTSICRKEGGRGDELQRFTPSVRAGIYGVNNLPNLGEDIGEAGYTAQPAGAQEPDVRDVHSSLRPSSTPWNLNRV